MDSLCSTGTAVGSKLTILDNVEEAEPLARAAALFKANTFERCTCTMSAQCIKQTNTILASNGRKLAGRGGGFRPVGSGGGRRQLAGATASLGDQET